MSGLVLKCVCQWIQLFGLELPAVFQEVSSGGAKPGAICLPFWIWPSRMNGPTMKVNKGQQMLYWHPLDFFSKYCKKKQKTDFVWHENTSVFHFTSIWRRVTLDYWTIMDLGSTLYQRDLAIQIDPVYWTELQIHTEVLFPWHEQVFQSNQGILSHLTFS